MKINDINYKILDIHINEYTSLDQLRLDMDEVDLHNPEQMFRLFENRRDAMNILKSYLDTNSHIRPFYHIHTEFNGTDYFQLYELVVD